MEIENWKVHRELENLPAAASLSTAPDKENFFAEIKIGEFLVDF